MKYVLPTLVLAALSCGRPAGPSPGDAARASARRHSAQAFQVLDLVGTRIEDFFGRRQERVDAFSDEIFGLRGKWRALFWGREDFERHVRRRFEEHVFRPEEFEREVVEAVRADLTFAIDVSEARLAADLNYWTRVARPGVAPPDVRPELSRLVSGLVVDDLGLNIASIAGAEAATLAASHVLTRMGVFGTSVAAGAGASWATLGIGLVIGTVAAVVIDAVVGGELEETARESVRCELDALRSDMLESPDGLWHGARRVLEAHGRALERSAARIVEGSDHASRRA